jgi:hypothetical protein
MRVGLTRFRVKPGRSDRVDEWMKTLNDRRAECLATLERELMYVEVVFRERTSEGDFLYWFSIQGEESARVETSPHDIDREHLDFWAECIDGDYGPCDCDPQLVLLQKEVADTIGWKDG